MVKYGKIYRKIQTPEWKKYYINYKLLKMKIKEIRNKLGNVIRTTTRLSRTSLLSSPLIPEEDLENENNALYKEENGVYLKEFIDLLIREFYRSYNFYIQIEKVLIKKMNAHLCTQTSYSNYNLQELSKEMKYQTYDDVIEKIHAKLPNTHLVMHGSSSVPQELQDLINAYGGQIPQTFGQVYQKLG